ncbi:MAG: phosphate ABC transporter permease PstA [Archaeoglobaceae archaeon]|nr:phosphate ABC transporter permease PstA [Archaeoglobaceae archaeon]MDW8128163.1 phosphate ABC transporter permease PstA [Archaeoglobaceae archaeon]
MLRELKNKVFILYLIISAFLVLFPLLHILFSVFANGIPVLLKFGMEFLTETLPAPNKPGGGIFPAIYGTFVMVFLASLIGIPLAVLAGIFVAEYPNNALSKATRSLLLIMMEFPTILVGLFVMAIIVLPLGSFSALAGAIALSIVMLPYVATYTEQAMRSVPQQYKEGAYALGLRKVRVVFSITLKIAKKGVVTGLLIGMAKVSGETAPLIFTAGNAWRSTGGALEPAGAVPLWIYYLVQQPYANYHELAWGAAFVLMVFFLAIFLPIRLSMVRS